MGLAAPERIAALDLVRGVAVLGILAVNISAFAGPAAASLTPHAPLPGTHDDELAFAAMLLLYEGKMRALFTMLFGASMLLLIERWDAAGRDGEGLQMRRLGWLLLIGFLHYILLWWGDILFLYAVCGFAALALRHLPLKPMAIAAVLAFTLWHTSSAISWVEAVAAEEAVLSGQPTAEQSRQNAAWLVRQRDHITSEMAEYRAPWAQQVTHKLTRRPFWQIEMALFNFGETLPLMLIGMALYRSGFFAGSWPRRHMRLMAVGGLILGLIPTVAVLGWALPRHYPPLAMQAAITSWAALPHLVMALAYLALLMLCAPRLRPTALGQRLCAAGEMALSNYIGMTLVMTFIFYGWGLGLVGHVPQAVLPAFVVLGWALMLGWSKPWLTHFRHGPLEWAWRSLTEGTIQPLRRSAPAQQDSPVTTLAGATGVAPGPHPQDLVA